MLDFCEVVEGTNKYGVTEIRIKFLGVESKDLMTKDNRFYAVFNEYNNFWYKDEYMVMVLIDKMLDDYVAKNHERLRDIPHKVLHTWDVENGTVDRWKKFVKHQQCGDHYHRLDTKLIFSEQEVTREDYATKRLKFTPKEGDMSGYEEGMSTWYSDTERRKAEYLIGSIVSGDSRTIHKFGVFFGPPGTGKSSVLNMVDDMFKGFTASVKAKDFGSSSAQFATEQLKHGPLVAIQHDGDLSKIEDNSLLNSIVAHEPIVMNEKGIPQYTMTIHAMLLMGTNKPVKITDAKSGILRRLIDISPTGKTLPPDRYDYVMSKIKFEYGAIAWHCLKVYESDKHYYDDYRPTKMFSMTNDFFDYISYYYDKYSEADGITLNNAYDDYTNYSTYANLSYKLPRRAFQNELTNYYKEFHDRYYLEDGTRVRNYFRGFTLERFETPNVAEKIPHVVDWLDLTEQRSLLDDYLKDCAAQYGSSKETPIAKWDDVTTKLWEIDTSRLHYVIPPIWLVVIDFDLKENGEKSLLKNLEAASTWPETYCELSKGGNGLHLHYIYKGDVNRLSSMVSDGIEVKVFKGKMSLRRRVSKCNNVPIAEIGDMLPLKKETTKVINSDLVQNEDKIKALILKAVRKEIWPNTKPNIDFIAKVLNDAYESGIHYDVRRLFPTVHSFAMHSSHQKEACVNAVMNMHFTSADIPEDWYHDDPGMVNAKIRQYLDDTIIIYDVEVFPNLLVIVWKALGAEHKPVIMINPSDEEVLALCDKKLIGFNCRKYDNHILYARTQGYDNASIYEVSRRIINKEEGAFFGQAYNISYADIFDYSSEKKGLKKFEIDLGIHHQELGFPWDEPVSEDKWQLVAEYCVNDVIATEALFLSKARQADFTARKILADIAGGLVNDTSNSLSAKLIFGKNKHPQNEFNYTFLGDDPRFKGYVFEHNPNTGWKQSTYKGFVVGEGGWVLAVPGMYGRVVTFDVASMHPSSVIALKLFGERYTKIFQELLSARLFIKHGEYEKAGELFDGKLKKYLTDKSSAKALAGALKIVINSVYGLTAASHPNPFKDDRNVDNIVAKRGALFMINLHEKLTEMGYQVIHVKTDSIKIVDPDERCYNFVMDFGKSYGYNFEIEHIFEKFCLVNKAVYIAKLAEDDPEWSAENAEAIENGEPAPTRWTATGLQFDIPYVFKQLFSGEPLKFRDYCEVKNVKEGNIYIDFNEGLADVSMYETCKELRDKAAKDKDRIFTKTEKRYLERFEHISDEELDELINAGHSYQFVGQTGLFTPVRDSAGGGKLVRIKDGKSYAVTGTKDFRWKEAEIIESIPNGMEQIDPRYFEELINDAIKTISEYGDFYEFIK